MANSMGFDAVRFSKMPTLESISQNYACISNDHFFMMTSSNENIFRVTGPLWGDSPVTGEFPSQRPTTRNFDVFFDLCLNKRLNKQSLGWWFETLSRSLWRHFNVFGVILGDSGEMLFMTPSSSSMSISGPVCNKQISRARASNYIPQYLWDVITCRCPWYLLRLKSPYMTLLDCPQ